MDKLIDYVSSPEPWVRPTSEIIFPGLKLLRVKREYCSLADLRRLPFITVETIIGPMNAVCEVIECLQRGRYNISIQDVRRVENRKLLHKYHFSEVVGYEFIWVA